MHAHVDLTIRNRLGLLETLFQPRGVHSRMHCIRSHSLASYPAVPLFFASSKKKHSTAKTGGGGGGGVFLPLVKDYFYSLVLQSNGQELFCRQKFWYGQTVKNLFALWSSSKNDGQNFLTPVLAVTTVHYYGSAMTTPPPPLGPDTLSCRSSRRRSSRPSLASANSPDTLSRCSSR